MKYLLYGIVAQDSAGCPPGICLIPAHGLAATVSAVEEMSAPPSVSSLLAYEKVVEAIHAGQAVIPLRYGCVMESESAVVRLLEDHHQEYGALLARLRGMTEMGIRVLWPASAEVLPDVPPSPGARYLASLRNRYHSAGVLDAEETQLADRIAGLLAGCSTEQRTEVSSSSQRRLLSLYFLTSRTGVERFRNQARQICPPSGAKILLSGPWPPYNFAGSPE
ncbi:MAG: GvpL/GvpF family gas vesicle protein [Bryobacteraceae bacterium]|jgi:hypothetical protein